LPDPPFVLKIQILYVTPYCCLNMKNCSNNSTLSGFAQARRFATSLAGIAVMGCSGLYAAPGALDTTYNLTGKVITDASAGGWDSAAGMAVYGAGPQVGKVVVVGYTDPTGDGGDVLVTRYLADGVTLDAGFGVGGHVIIDIGGAGNADSANAVALDSTTGNVVVVGFTSDDPVYDDADLDSLILRLTPAGLPDATFGVGNPGLVSPGVVKTTLAVVSNDEFRGVAICPNGKIVAVGQAVNDSTNDFSVVCYNANGTLDLTFANKGVLMTGITVEDIAEDVVIKLTPTLLLPNDYRIIVVGETHGLVTAKGAANDMAMIQVTPTGALDSTFGKAGKVITSFSLGYDRAEAVVLQPDGMIVVAGRQTLPNAAVVARFSKTGVLDPKFGTKGLTVTPLTPPPLDVAAFDYGSSDLFGSLSLDGDKILFSAYEYAGTKTQAVLLRYNADGKADTGFGVGGKASILEGEYADGVQTVKLADGHILVAGTTIDSLDNANILLMRFDGSVVVATTAATSIANTSAVLNGNVTGDGSATNAVFQWGLTPAALTNTLPVAAPVTGTVLTPVNATLNFLTPGLKYYYRVVAGGSVGATLFVTTTKLLVVAPVAKTLPAVLDLLTPTTKATLNGSVDAKGTNVTAVNFQWGTAATYGSEVAGTPASVNINGPITSSTVLTGLLPHTKYNYRIRGASSVGSSNGANMTFTTGNSLPMGNPETALVVPLAKVAITVLANDTDADGDKLKVLSFTQAIPATAGVVTKVGDTLFFTAKATFVGGSFTYIAADVVGGKSPPVTVTLTNPLVPAIIGAPAATTPGQTVRPEGGVVNFDVTAGPTVAWITSKTDAWIALYPTTSLVGNGKVMVTVQPNKTLLPRTALIKIGGVTVHTITQTAGVPPVFAAAAFSGLVDRDLSLNNNLGGSLSLATTVTGAASGKLVLGATTYAFKGGFLTDANATSVDLRKFEGIIVRKAPLPDLKLQLTYNTVDNSIGFIDPTDGLTVNGAGLVKVRGYRHTFSKTITPTTAPTLLAPAGFATDYTVALEHDSLTWQAERGVPDGTGYLTMKVLTTGATTWAGKLADGTAVTGSATVWPTGEVNIFKTLYKNGGSLFGAQAIELVTSNLNSVEDSEDFPLTWLKPRNGQMPYAGEFGIQELLITGAQYVKPTTGAFFMGLDNAANNASISFTDGEIENVEQFSSLDQIFSIGAAPLNKITPNLLLATNPALVKLTKIDPVKGIFTGSMTLLDTGLLAPISVIKLKRAVTFQGVFISAHETSSAVPVAARGTGYFLLNTLPDATGEVITKTPQLSGTVNIVDPTP
jgi:uncharacterized delta-60 repeat protein